MAYFELKTEIYFGRGEAANTVRYLSEHGFTRCGVVIDSDLPDQEVFRDIIDNLKKGLGYCKVLTYGLKKEPTYEYLDEIKDFFKSEEIGCLIGIGGGSVIDTAKGIAVLITNPVKSSKELRGFPNVSRSPAPVVAMPTISGTGTEVTYNAVFISESEKVKLGINTRYNFPVFAILDPELSVNAPLKQSLSSALDCLVHSLESFMSKKATFITRPLSIESFHHVISGIEGILKDSRNITAREELMKASYLAGIALMNSSSGPAGAFSYPLGTLLSLPHGFACAFFLPAVLRYNITKGYNDFYILYDRVYGCDQTSKEEKARRMVEDIIEVIKRSGMPERLSDLGVKREHIPAFVRQSKGAFDMNPVAMADSEMERFLSSAL